MTRSVGPIWSLGAWAAVLALASWVRWLDPLLLGAAATALVISLRSPQLRRGPGALAVVTLILAVVAAFIGDRELGRVAADWERIRESREEAFQSSLGDALDQVIRDGDRALELLLPEPGQSSPSSPASVRRATGMDAVALFDGDGTLLTWDGEHHGRIPSEVRTGEPRYLYGERPLFGYLYFTAPVEGGGAVMAARLLRAELPPTMNGTGEDLASKFERETGAVVHISSAERVEGESVWDLRWEDEVLFSVALAPLTQAETREALVGRWGGIVAALLLLAWVLLARVAAIEGGGAFPRRYPSSRWSSSCRWARFSAFPASSPRSTFCFRGRST